MIPLMYILGLILTSNSLLYYCCKNSETILLSCFSTYAKLFSITYTPMHHSYRDLGALIACTWFRGRFQLSIWVICSNQKIWNIISQPIETKQKLIQRVKKGITAMTGENAAALYTVFITSFLFIFHDLHYHSNWIPKKKSLVFLVMFLLSFWALSFEQYSLTLSKMTVRFFHWFCDHLLRTYHTADLQRPWKYRQALEAPDLVERLTFLPSTKHNVSDLEKDTVSLG